jgi:hypothetical protein
MILLKINFSRSSKVINTGCQDNMMVWKPGKLHKKSQKLKTFGPTDSDDVFTEDLRGVIWQGWLVLPRQAQGMQTTAIEIAVTGDSNSWERCGAGIMLLG